MTNASSPGRDPIAGRVFWIRISLWISVGSLPLLGKSHLIGQLSEADRTLSLLFVFIVIVTGACGTMFMIGSYGVWFTTRNMPLANTWMKRGVGLVCWAAILLPEVFLEAVLYP